MDRIDPADPTDRIDPADPILRIDPDEPVESIEPLAGRPACLFCTGPSLRHDRRAAKSWRAIISRMRAIAARVTSASVTVAGQVVGEITRPGLLVLVGVTHRDTQGVSVQLARKLHGLRILRDEESCESAGAPLLIVSQFTLYGQTSKGRRPTWIDAAPRDIAEPLVDAVVSELRWLGATVATGIFGAEMALTSVNDGPFTVLIDL